MKIFHTIMEATTDRRQTRAAAKEEERKTIALAASNAREILVIKGKLFIALQCIYLQNDMTIVMSLGKPRPDRGNYDEVLTQEDFYGEWVLGYMAQGCVKTPPMDQQSKKDDHIAAFVHTDWIYAHMFLAPHNSRYSPSFNEAVKLVRRASETMCRVSYMIMDAATNLADKLGKTDGILEADAAAEAALVPENDLQVSIPRLPYEVKLWFEYPPAVVAHADKTSARMAFEHAVCTVFSYNVCTSIDKWTGVNDVLLCTTGLPKRYDDMTAEERVSSGSVVLGNIMKDLHNNEATVPHAIAASLVAARALAYSARKLELACQAYEEECAI